MNLINIGQTRWRTAAVLFAGVMLVSLVTFAKAGNTSPATYKIMAAGDGGQVSSFSAVPGGCVHDNVTGLTWEVKTADGGLRDWNKTYTNHSATYDPYRMFGKPTDASGFEAAVNATRLCGFSDWRLPTADELQSLVDYGAVFRPETPAVDASWFPNTQGERYWSATSYAGGAGNAWYIQLDSGAIVNDVRSDAYHVLLVRADGRPQSALRYTVSDDGQEVADSQTGLIWRRCAEGMTYRGGTCTGTATTFTNEAVLQETAGHASSNSIAWRLPNIKELNSIADRSRSNPAIDPVIFPATPSGWFWSATLGSGSSDDAWGVSFITGYVGTAVRHGTGNAGYVRLMHAGQ